ncbi:hypothetical protein AGMMS50212_03660 [Spirochaetia bacterium]|nr:hypothetical protein AGMMS50212_03660 [Spirochaetia bacterium]
MFNAVFNRKFILVALFFTLVPSTGIFAGGGKEPPRSAPARQVKTPPPPPPKPSNPYFSGDGGEGKSIAVLIPAAEGLGKDDAYLPAMVQGVFVGDFSKFSGFKVLDRQSLDKVLAEGESGIYGDNADFAELGGITGTQYIMTGKLLKTKSGYSLQVQITDSKTATTNAAYTGVCTAAELDNFTGIKKASQDLLTAMGVSLTDRGRQELSGINEQAVKSETSLAKGITAQKSGTEVQTLAYYYQAAAIDPSLTEAISRVSIMSANISSGNIGQNVRNDIAWRDGWIARLTETENFFRDYNKIPPPYDLVYSTDVQTGATNYADRTAALSFGIELLPASLEWFDTMAKVVKTVYAGLTATGRTKEWGLQWPQKTVSQGTSPFTGQDKTFTIVTELVNENGVSIGRQSIALAYGWRVDFSDNPAIKITAKPVVSRTVTFPAVKADLITDKLTIKIVSVNGIAAETAGKDGRIMIAAKTDYDRSPHGIAARQANEYLANGEKIKLSNGTITGYSGKEGILVIPTTLNNGEPVTSIGERTFMSKQQSLLQTRF